MNAVNDAVLLPSSLSLVAFAKTLKAWHLHKLAVRSGPVGLPIDVDRPITAEPAPLVSAAEAMAEASRLLDEALADLQAGGAAFPFTFVPGYEGFTTPATFQPAGAAGAIS